jgi:hypothetical protein
VIQAAPSPAGVLKCGYMGTGRIRHRMLVLGLSGRVWSVLLPRSHPTKAHKCLQEGALVPCISVNLGNDDDKARTTRNLDPPRQTLKLLCTSSPLESHFLPTWHLPPILAAGSGVCHGGQHLCPGLQARCTHLWLFLCQGKCSLVPQSINMTLMSPFANCTV